MVTANQTDIMEPQLSCSICAKKGETVTLQKENDKLVCPKCGSSWFIEGESPLGRYQETWKDNSDFLFVLLRPELPSNIILEQGLKELLQDCYQTLLIGRYNASIVMMGVFLEALMKERIRIKTGKDFKGPYAKCVDKLMGLKRLRKDRVKVLEHGTLVNSTDILFLDRFRDKFRNTYAHFDEAKVVNGRVHQIWKIPEKDILNISKFEEILKEVKKGQRKSMLVDATHPALRSISKFDVDRVTAVQLFNVVYDFSLGFIFKYLRQKDYDQYNAHFPNPFVDLSSVPKIRENESKV